MKVLQYVKPVLSAGVILSLATTGCHKKPDQESDSPQTVQIQPDANGQNPDVKAAPAKPSPTGHLSKKPGKVKIPQKDLPVISGDDQNIVMPNGEYIKVQMIAGNSYIPVEGAMDDASFATLSEVAKSNSTNDAEMRGHLLAALKNTISKLSDKVTVIGTKTYPEVGYFTALIPLSEYETLGSIEGLPADLIINPVFTEPLDERSVRVMDAEAKDAMVDARSNTDAFSGLKRIGVEEFLATVEAETGASPTGSNVKVGVTDTGITLSHPSFNDKEGASRITYMKDFTGEGRLHFNPTAKFEATIAEGEEVNVDFVAEVVPPTDGTRLPNADELVEIAGTMKVSPELMALLKDADAAIKMGALSESSFAGIDLDQDGSTSDVMFALLVAKDGEYSIFFDKAGSFDFRQAKQTGNWNTTKDIIEISAEFVGFDIRPVQLPTSLGLPLEVMSASIVGYDPGGHGSHVAGIIGGLKTITNDNDGTLARGVAPGAELMMNRICANSSGCDSREAIIDLALNGAEVINMSIGGLSAFNDGYSVNEIIINRLTEARNVVFVISAGNSGPGKNTVGSPSTARLAISVGATASKSMIERQYQWPGTGKSGPLDAPASDDDFLLFFSSRGPTAAGGFKPNLTAPGTELSAVPFNQTQGNRAGLDVYWGTSMAAPTAAGAVALLIDAAKLYNAKYPENPLPLDALTIRKVVINSAKGFDVKKFDPSTGEVSNGQYTWIDQGMGMINLPAAWAALKAERDSKLPSAVYVETEAGREDIALDYQVRVLRTGPNGIPYDGSLTLPDDMFQYTGPLFGRGIWLDANGTDRMIPVHIARRLPYSATVRSDVGALKRLLTTTKDEFVLKTVYFGANKEWLKAGTLNQMDCSDDPSGNVTIIGEGATDNFGANNGGSRVALDSALNVCLDRAAMATLPAGDQGAIIMAYRVDGEQQEAHPSFVVPVYVNIPHKTLAGSAGYEINGTVQSFGVDRHYVQIPEGASLVTVEITVPESELVGNDTVGCQSVRLYAYENGNTATPAEIRGLASVAKNCNNDGSSANNLRTVKYTRLNPTPGIWDLHVFGRYRFAQSNYTMKVEFAKVALSQEVIEGTPDALNGEIEFEILEASLDAQPSEDMSSMVLNGFALDTAATLLQDEFKIIPGTDGSDTRSYPADVVAVEISTGDSPGNDIDLFVYECDNADMAVATCGMIGSSTTATEVESVAFAPRAGMFYVAFTHGYTINDTAGSPFRLTELRQLDTVEPAQLSVTSTGEASYKIEFNFDVANSTLLNHELFLTGGYRVEGSLSVKTAAGETMIGVPVRISAPAQ